MLLQSRTVHAHEDAPVSRSLSRASHFVAAESFFSQFRSVRHHIVGAGHVFHDLLGGATREIRRPRSRFLSLEAPVPGVAHGRWWCHRRSGAVFHRALRISLSGSAGHSWRRAGDAATRRSVGAPGKRKRGSWGSPALLPLLAPVGVAPLQPAFASWLRQRSIAIAHCPDQGLACRISMTRPT
jgi:hypothetical protein